PEADAALLSTIDVLVAYQGKYDTYALVNPLIADKTKLVHVLDLLTANGMKFAFDVYSSDTVNLGTSAPLNAPVAVNAGMALWPHRGGRPTAEPGPLSSATRSPRNFRGLRIHEPGYVLQNYLNQSPPWPIDLSVPGGAEDLMRQFVAFAAQNGMWVEYNSPTF